MIQTCFRGGGGVGLPSILVKSRSIYFPNTISQSLLVLQKTYPKVVTKIHDSIQVLLIQSNTIKSYSSKTTPQHLCLFVILPKLTQINF